MTYNLKQSRLLNCSEERERESERGVFVGQRGGTEIHEIKDGMCGR